MILRSRTGLGLACVILGIFLLSCQRESPSFDDVSSEAGIDFLYNFGDYTYENILESSGSGVTVFDYDQDGWMDLYMLNGTWLEGISDEEGRVFENTPNRLYRNLGNGRFEELAEEAGVDDRNWSMAAAPVDIDLDGDQDLYLLNYGPNRFYINQGDGRFVDNAESMGLVGPDSLNGFVKWSVGAAFWDYNLDGLLDVCTGNFLAFDPEYVSPTHPDMMPHPAEYKGQASLMYEQQADGSFREQTEPLGLLHPDSKCMGLTVWDFDRDGDLDMFQGNDHQANFMFRNEGRDFSEVAVEVGVAVNSHGQTTGSMHGAIGDVDGDGLIDLLVPDLRYGAMYRKQANGSYEDITEKSGIAAAFDGKGQWATALFDYDNDGDLDLFAANGNGEELILQYPLLMENDGSGHFRDVGKNASPYFREKRSGRAAAAWDYDNDGDLDLIISHVDLKARSVLLRNNCRNGNHWLGLSLEGRDGPAAAIGAAVLVHRKNSSAIFVNQSGNTYLSFNDPRLHIGLGKDPHIERIEILWSDGTREVYPGPAADQYLTFRQGYGIVD